VLGPGLLTAVAPLTVLHAQLSGHLIVLYGGRAISSSPGRQNLWTGLRAPLALAGLAGALLVAMQWRASPPVLRRLLMFAVVWYLLHELPPMKPYPEGARHMTVMAAVFAEIEEIEQWPGFIVLNELFAEQYLKAL
jgi:hypothetical protein